MQATAMATATTAQSAKEDVAQTQWRSGYVQSAICMTSACRLSKASGPACSLSMHPAWAQKKAGPAPHLACHPMCPACDMALLLARALLQGRSPHCSDLRRHVLRCNEVWPSSSYTVHWNRARARAAHRERIPGMVSMRCCDACP
eukprot:356198-Chlamydomonas_euryale.AAC.3